MKLHQLVGRYALLITTLGWAPSSVEAATLTTIHTFATGSQAYRNPYDAPLITGTGADTTLWFTMRNGGPSADSQGNGGGLMSYKLSDGTITPRITNFGAIDNNANYAPRNPEGSPVYSSATSILVKSLVVDGNGDEQAVFNTVTSNKGFMYFTTADGAIGQSGSLVAYNMETGGYSLVWESDTAPDNYVANDGRVPRGAPIVIDRGAAGQDIYFSTSTGGQPVVTADPAHPNAATSGAVYRYNTKDGVAHVVRDFDGRSPTGLGDGGQPYDGFVQVGDKLYMTTFVGGAAASGTGPGTLGVIDLNTNTYTTLASLSGTTTSGATSADRLPASTPFYDAVTNALYFTTVGSNGNPGVIDKYFLGVGAPSDSNYQAPFLSTIYALPAGQNSGPNEAGRQIGYTSPYVYDGFLYYLARLGGDENLGTLNRLNLLTSTNETLYHLDATTGYTAYGDFAFSDYDFDGDGLPDPALYFMVSAGLGGNGGILRLSDLDTAVVPEPSRLILAGLALGLVVLRRRRPRHDSVKTTTL